MNILSKISFADFLSRNADYKQNSQNTPKRPKVEYDIHIHDNWIRDLFEDETEYHSTLKSHPNTKLIDAEDKVCEIDLPFTLKRHLAPSRSNCIFILSVDMLIRCFEYLTEPFELSKLCLVCSKFTDIIENSCVWEKYFSNIHCLVQIGNHPNEYERSLKSLPSLAPQSDVASANVETWICSSCSLTQALASSEYCEFCGAVRPETSTNLELPVTRSLPYIIVNSKSELTELWILGRHESELMLRNREFTDPSSNQTMEFADIPLPTYSSYYHPNHIVLQNRLNEETDEFYNWRFNLGMPNLHDGIAANSKHSKHHANRLYHSYHRSKSYAISKVYQNKWDNFHSGWEWICRELRCSLRCRWNRYCNSETASNLHSLPSHFSKILNKLITHDWSLFYDSLKTEIALQAEGLSRDLKSNYYTKVSKLLEVDDSCMSIIDHGVDNSSKLSELSVVMREYLEYVLQSTEIFLQWGEEVSDTCYELNDYIMNNIDYRMFSNRFSNQEANDVTDEQNDLNQQNSLTVSDICLLSLRNHLFLRRSFLNVFEQVLKWIEMSLDQSLGENKNINQCNEDISIVKESKNIVKILLRYHNLFELISSVPDEKDSMSSPSQRRFQRVCLNRLESIATMARHFRQQSLERGKNLDEIKNSSEFGSLMKVFDETYEENPNEKSLSNFSHGVIDRLSILRQLDY